MYCNHLSPLPAASEGTAATVLPHVLDDASIRRRLDILKPKSGTPQFTTTRTFRQRLHELLHNHDELLHNRYDELLRNRSTVNDIKVLNSVNMLVS